MNVFFGPPADIQNNITFEWRIKNYDYFSDPGGKGGTQVLFIEYPKMEVKIESKVPMVDLNAFISSVGGSLGLFLGFSIIDTLFFFYKFIYAHCPGKNRPGQSDFKSFCKGMSINDATLQ